MGFIVYNSTTFIIDSLHFTQAEANTSASKSTDLTARVGSLAIPRNIQLGRSYYNATDGAIEADAPIVLSDLESLKEVLRAAHHQFFDSWYPGLLAEAPGHTDETRALGINLLLGGWKSVYLTARTTTVSHALRKAKANQMSRGASDVASPFQFYSVAEELTIPANYTPGDPVSWVVVNSDGDDFEARSLQAAINAARTDYTTIPSFANVQLTNPAWIDVVT